jgi:radical SAM protein with 4Fe4S-binding SPASM domain
MPAEQAPERPPLLYRLQNLGRHNRLPLDVTLELTHFCNLDCIHCYVVDRHQRDPRELSTEQWIGVLDQLADAGTLRVTFTGGEVLTRPDWHDILSHARERSFSIELITNGTLMTAEMADRLADLCLWEVGVSLYAADPEVHDAVVQREGSFAKSRRAIELLRGRGVKVRIKSVLLTANITHYPGLIDLARELGTRLSIDPTVTARNDGSSDNQRFAITLEEFRTVLTDPVVPPDALKFDAAQLEASRQEKLGRTACQAGVTMCSVDPTGKVLPCMQWLEPAGDLVTERFSEVWRTSPVLLEAARMVTSEIPECHECEYLALCNRCPAAAFLETGNPHAPYPLACAQAEVVAEIRNAKEEGAS